MEGSLKRALRRSRQALAAGLLLACLGSPSAVAQRVTGHWDVNVAGANPYSKAFTNITPENPTPSHFTRSDALGIGGVTATMYVDAASAIGFETTVGGPVKASSKLAVDDHYSYWLSFPTGGASVDGGKLIFHVVLEGTLSGNASVALTATMKAEEADPQFDLTTVTGSYSVSIDDPSPNLQRREFDVVVGLVPSLYPYSPTDPLQGSIGLSVSARADIAPTGGAQGNASVSAKNSAKVTGFRVLNSSGVQVPGFKMDALQRQPAGVPIPELAAGQATAVEYYNQGLDHYFLTHVVDEIAKLDSGAIKGWSRTGQSFLVYSAAGAGTSPVCRFYIPPAQGNSHFYGRGMAECAATAQKNPSFVNEDPQFFHAVLPTAGTCPAGTREVYRVFSNRPDANHRYMVDQAIRTQMVAEGWLAEGDGPNLVVMCLPA